MATTDGDKAGRCVTLAPGGQEQFAWGPLCCSALVGVGVGIHTGGASVTTFLGHWKDRIDYSLWQLIPRHWMLSVASWCFCTGSISFFSIIFWKSSGFGCCSISTTIVSLKLTALSQWCPQGGNKGAIGPSLKILAPDLQVTERYTDSFSPIRT